MATIERICQQCGTAFQARAWNVKQGGAKYCSRGCKNDSATTRTSGETPSDMPWAMRCLLERNHLTRHRSGGMEWDLADEEHD